MKTQGQLYDHDYYLRAEYKLPVDEMFYKIHDHADIIGTVMLIKLIPAPNLIELVQEQLSRKGFTSTILSGFTPEYGLGNYLSITIEDQAEWDRVIQETQVIEFCEPIIYTQPVFEYSDLCSHLFTIDLRTKTEWATRYGESIAFISNSQRFEEIVGRNQPIFVTNGNRTVAAARGLLPDL